MQPWWQRKLICNQMSSQTIQIFCAPGKIRTKSRYNLHGKVPRVRAGVLHLVMSSAFCFLKFSSLPGLLLAKKGDLWGRGLLSPTYLQLRKKQKWSRPSFTNGYCAQREETHLLCVWGGKPRASLWRTCRLHLGDRQKTTGQWCWPRSMERPRPRGGWLECSM